MDAPPVTKVNTFAHASTHKGKMHACGHDGHVAMLLAAARALQDREQGRKPPSGAARILLSLARTPPEARRIPI